MIPFNPRSCHICQQSNNISNDLNHWVQMVHCLFTCSNLTSSCHQCRHPWSNSSDNYIIYRNKWFGSEESMKLYRAVRLRSCSRQNTSHNCGSTSTWIPASVYAHSCWDIPSKSQCDHMTLEPSCWVPAGSGFEGHWTHGLLSVVCWTRDT